MGQKSNPTGLRIGVIRTWSSKWYEEGSYAKWLKEDLRIKKFIKDEYGHTGINRIEIERAANKVKVSVYTAKPGIIIGKKGKDVEVLKDRLRKMSNSEVFLNIQELRKAGNKYCVNYCGKKLAHAPLDIRLKVAGRLLREGLAGRNASLAKALFLKPDDFRFLL